MNFYIRRLHISGRLVKKNLERGGGTSSIQVVFV